MASPIDAALDTYELLERVLTNLPMKQLFVVQRVSLTWKAVIERSQPLQKKMFLLADGQPLGPVEDDKPSAWRESPVYTTNFEFNAALFVNAYLSIRRHLRLKTMMCLLRSLRPYSELLSEDRFATLRQTYLTAPPITALDFEALGEDDNRFGVPRALCTIYNREGLRMSDLYDVCSRLRDCDKQPPDNEYSYSSLRVVLPDNSSHDNDANGSDFDRDCVCKFMPTFMAE